jgi:ArsR family transcriptional regulator
MQYIEYNAHMSTADQLYIALSDKVRRRLVALLLKEDELCVCELREVMRLPQPKDSRHLSILRDAGIVTVRRVGTWIFYRVSVHAPAWAHKIIELMAQGETTDSTFMEDAARLERRPVRYAEIDLPHRKTACAPCKGRKRSAKTRATSCS